MRHHMQRECCSVLQCVAVCCSVLQCVAVCCSVLQPHHMRHHMQRDLHTWKKTHRNEVLRSHTRRSHVTHLKSRRWQTQPVVCVLKGYESCHTYEGVMSPIWRIHVYIWTANVTHTHTHTHTTESCHTLEVAPLRVCVCVCVCVYMKSILCIWKRDQYICKKTYTCEKRSIQMKSPRWYTPCRPHRQIKRDLYI